MNTITSNPEVILTSNQPADLSVDLCTNDLLMFRIKCFTSFTKPDQKKFIILLSTRKK